MARLQDFQTVTPSATNDKLLIVQATGQGNATIKAVGDTIFGAETAGSLPLGSTTPSGSTASAINTNKNNIGTLSNLTTSNKTNLVNAINEVNSCSLKIAVGTGTSTGTSYSIPTGGSTNGSWLVAWGGAYVGFVTIFSTTVTITKVAGSTAITATAAVSGNNINITLSGVPYNSLRYVKLF